MSVSTPNTIRSRTTDAQGGAQQRVDPAAVRRRGARRRGGPARSAADRSSTTSQQNSTSTRVTLKPLAKNARYPGFARFSASIRLTVRITSSASPESRFPRLAPPFDQQPVARRVRGARSRRSPPARSRSSPCRTPSRPTGTPGCRRSSPAGSPPGWRRSATQVGLPLGQQMRAAAAPAVPSRARCRRASPARSTGSARPSISRKTIPGASCATCAALPAGDSPDHPQHVRVVVVGAEEHLRARLPRPSTSAATQRPAERVDLDRVGVDLRGEQQHDGVEEEHRTKPSAEREGQPQRRHDRRQDRIQDRDHRRGDERLADTVDGDVRNDRGGHADRRSGDDPVDREVQRVEARHVRAPDQLFAVGGVELSFGHRRCDYRRGVRGDRHSVRTMDAAQASPGSATPPC